MRRRWPVELPAVPAPPNRREGLAAAAAVVLSWLVLLAVLSWAAVLAIVGSVR